MTILKDGTKVRIYDMFGEVIDGTIHGNDEEMCEGDLTNLNYYVVPNGKTFDDEIMIHWKNIDPRYVRELNKGVWNSIRRVETIK